MSTYKDVYLKGVNSLKDAYVEEAALDARLLLEYVCSSDRNTLLAYPETEVNADDEAKFLELIQKRAKKVPLSYITGSREFMGLDFLVNEDVLIPRQDTECLVEEALTYIDDNMRVLDMCTGSGCILLSIMNYKNGIEGVGADISVEALEVARENAERLNIEGVTFIESDLFDALGDAKFDVIVSNPPYIRLDVIPTLMDEVKRCEPMLALCGGRDGLDFYRQIAKDAKEYLNNYGKIFLEIGYDQGLEVSEIFAMEGYCDIEVKEDLCHNPRVVVAKYVR